MSMKILKKRDRRQSCGGWLQRNFCCFLFVTEFFLALVLLGIARYNGLLGMPHPGMDQHTILLAAMDIPNGVLPVPGRYLYSPAYTLLLGFFAALTGGNLICMRILQAGLCALIPVMICRTGRLAGCSRLGAELAGLAYLFCGSALLISLDFLRAAPLALCTITWFYFLLCARRDPRYWWLAGVFAGLCILGRENFIPVVFLPWLFAGALHLFQKEQWHWRPLLIYTAAVLLILLPVLCYNFYYTGSLAILPGNGKNVFECMQGKGSCSSPLTAVKNILLRSPKTIWSFLTPFENPNSLSIYAFREAIPFLKVLALPVTLLWGLAAAAVLGCGSRSRRNLQLAVIIVIGYFMTLLFCDIYYRFRIPVLPLLCLLGGAGTAKLLRYLRRKQYGRFALAALPSAAAGAAVLMTIPEPLLPQSERDVTIRFLTDRERFQDAAQLLLKYRRLGIDSPAGERFLLTRIARTGNRDLFDYYWKMFVRQKNLP